MKRLSTTTPTRGKKPLPRLAPAAPDGLTASAGNGSATLFWNASAGGTAYTLYRSLVRGGPYSPVHTGPDLQYADSGLTNGVTYYYVVTASNAYGASGYSLERAVEPLGPQGQGVVIPASVSFAMGALDYAFEPCLWGFWLRQGRRVIAVYSFKAANLLDPVFGTGMSNPQQFSGSHFTLSMAAGTLSGGGVRIVATYTLDAPRSDQFESGIKIIRPFGLWRGSSYTMVGGNPSTPQTVPVGPSTTALPATSVPVSELDVATADGLLSIRHVFSEASTLRSQLEIAFGSDAVTDTIRWEAARSASVQTRTTTLDIYPSLIGGAQIGSIGSVSPLVNP